MKHEYEDNIKCPYCDYEDNDSWEFTDEEGEYTCGECGEEFNVSRNIEVTYSTSRIDCEENKTKHDYKIESYFEGKRKFVNGVWENLAEDDFDYWRIMECSKCGDKEYIKISKEEYFKTK